MNTLAIHDHKIHTTISIDRTALEPDIDLPSNAFYWRPAEETFQRKNLDVNMQNTETASNEYAVDRIVSYECSGDDLCYLISR